jgi:hypothetical protein
MFILKIAIALILAIYIGGYLCTMLTLFFQMTIGVLIAAISFDWLSLIWTGVFFGYIVSWFTRFTFLWIVKEYNWTYLTIVAVVLLFMKLRPNQNVSSSVAKNGYIIAAGNIIGFIIGNSGLNPFGWK